jgi:hypothetical protein
MTLWKQVVQYVNETFLEDKIIYRRGFLITLGLYKKGAHVNTVADTYRQTLTKAGFLSHPYRGVYYVKKLIPEDMTMRKCRRLAYN